MDDVFDKLQMSEEQRKKCKQLMNDKTLFKQEIKKFINKVYLEKTYDTDTLMILILIYVFYGDTL